MCGSGRRGSDVAAPTPFADMLLVAQSRLPVCILSSEAWARASLQSRRKLQLQSVQMRWTAHISGCLVMQEKNDSSCRCGQPAHCLGPAWRAAVAALTGRSLDTHWTLSRPGEQAAVMLGRLLLIDAQARIIVGGCCTPGMHAWSDDLSRRPPESQTSSRCPDVATDVSSNLPSPGHSTPLHGWALEEKVVLTILPTLARS